MNEAQGRQKIFTSIPKKHNASFEYRLVIPLMTMEELGLPVYPIIDWNDAAVEQEARIMAFSYSDFNVLYQPVSHSLVGNLDMLANAKGGRRPDGTWKWTPTFMIDTDDDLFNVHPCNPAYGHLGANRMDGTPLMPGDEVGMLDDDGTPKVIWRDGHKGFDIARNQQTLMVYRELLKRANGITVTTPEVEKYVKREVPQAWTYIYPNSLRFDHYPDVELGEHPDEIRVLWQGSTTHYEDIFPITGAMAEVSARYPQVKWVFWGANYKSLQKTLPEGKYRFLPWVQYEEYKPRLSMINHDINICPLTDHQFNRCRSAIKFYESSAICKPAATLAQATGPYKAEIIEGETGLLWNTAEEFVEKMSLLVEDAKLRRTLAGNAKDWVHEHRDAVKNVPKLWEFYQTVRDKQKADNPEPIMVPREEQYDAVDLEFDANHQQG